MKKLLFIIAMAIATTVHASTAPVLECSGSSVDYEFGKNILVTGTVKNTGKLPVADVAVSFFLPSGEFVTKATTDATGKYAVSLPPNPYIASVFNLSGTGVWNGNVPRDQASRLVLKIKSTANFVLDDVKPVVSGVQTTTLETTKGNLTGYIITGSGFGSVKGYVDVAGYLTNSTSYLVGWSDTQIKLIKNTSMPLSGCFKVFSKYSGYSDCFSFAYQPPS
jgi:hypothetical protein